MDFAEIKLEILDGGARVKQEKPEDFSFVLPECEEQLAETQNYEDLLVEAEPKGKLKFENKIKTKQNKNVEKFQSRMTKCLKKLNILRLKLKQLQSPKVTERRSRNAMFAASSSIRRTIESTCVHFTSRRIVQYVLVICARKFSERKVLLNIT